MKKLMFFFSLLMIPTVSAEEECGLLNLATCIPQKIFDFALDIITSPISLLLDFIRSLLTSPVDTSLFGPLWVIMVYILSLFYGLLMLYSGFNFMISGYDAIKREKAKEWLRNTIIMIVLVQASYFLYSMTVQIGSAMTSGTINLIDESFFQINADNIVNIGLQFFFASFYVIALLLTATILTIRYLIVAAGVAIIPLGIFLYFIPPLKSYGKFILNFLGICIFITFFDAIIFLASSKLLEIALFDNMKILIMISAFGISNILMLYLMFFSVIKAVVNFTNKATGVIILATKYFV